MTRISTLSTQVRILQRAVSLCEDRLDTAAAERVVQQVDARLAMMGDYVTVAVAGATGSGKSTTVNALVGQDVMRVSLRRPTTSVPMAAVGDGNVDPAPLLDWLGITGRTEVLTRQCRDLIVIDMPDTDSIFRGNRLEVDRLVDLVDLIVWVVDPQKYADRILHRDYLQRLKPFSRVMLVALNRVDELSTAQARRCLADLRRLLDEDGLSETPLVAISAISKNVNPVREWVTTNRESSARRRLEGDVATAVVDLDAKLGRYSPPGLSAAQVDVFIDELSVAAGVPAIVDSVTATWAIRGASATAWPLTRIPDLFTTTPSRVAAEGEPIPGDGEYRANVAQQSRADTALRTVISEATFGLPQAWATAVSQEIWSNRSHLLRTLDEKLIDTELGVRADRGWWRWFAAMQWALLTGVVAAMLWWMLGVFELAPLPKWGLVPWPPILAGLAGLGGVALAGVGRLLSPVSALKKAKDVEKALRATVAEVATTEVIEVLEDETGRFLDAVATLDRIRR